MVGMSTGTVTVFDPTIDTRRCQNCRESFPSSVILSTYVPALEKGMWLCPDCRYTVPKLAQQEKKIRDYKETVIKEACAFNKPVGMTITEYVEGLIDKFGGIDVLLDTVSTAVMRASDYQKVKFFIEFGKLITASTSYQAQRPPVRQMSDDELDGEIKQIAREYLRQLGKDGSQQLLDTIQEDAEGSAIPV